LKVAEDKLHTKPRVADVAFKRGQQRLAIIDTALPS
jgi:hypothetical protein